MEKFIGVIQITDSKIKLVIGSVVDNKPILVYSTERTILGAVQRGRIINFNVVEEILKSLYEIKDEEAKLRITCSDAIVILPPIGFKVYQSTKTTQLVGDSNIVQPIDVINCINMFKKVEINDNDRIVDIVPNNFLIDNNKYFKNIPLGEASRSLTINANIQILPETLINTYDRVFASTQIRVRKYVCEPYALTSLGKTKKEIPSSYLLIDTQDGITSLCLVSNDSPIKSTYFEIGFKDLVNDIMDYFDIGEEEAMNLINLYGINERDLNFDPVILTKGDKKYFPKDLNTAIEAFADKYIKQLNASYSSLMAGLSVKVKQAPVVFCGSLYEVHGFAKLIEDNFAEAKSKHILCPKTIGARKSEYSALIGALLANYFDKGNLSEQYSKVAQVDRVKDNKKQK